MNAIASMHMELVGTTGFEPVTTTPPVWCATRLRYAPDQRGAIVLDSVRIEMVLAFWLVGNEVRNRRTSSCCLFDCLVRFPSSFV